MKCYNKNVKLYNFYEKSVVLELWSSIVLDFRRFFAVFLGVQAILFWGDAVMFSELEREIREVLEATVECNVLDRSFRIGGEEVFCAVKALAKDVLCYAETRQLLEFVLEYPWRQAGHSNEHFKGYPFCVVLVDVFQYLGDCVWVAFCRNLLPGIGQIQYGKEDVQKGHSAKKQVSRQWRGQLLVEVAYFSQNLLQILVIVKMQKRFR